MMQKKITKAQLKKLVEPTIWSQLKDNNYYIKCINPRKLVTYHRLDVALRVLYLELRKSCIDLADEIYYHDIRAQSLGTLVDPDNSKKADYKTFKKTFEDVYNNIAKNGFTPSRTLIPVSLDGSILNGGHRLASALHTNKNVWIIATHLPPICCDYRYFHQRCVPDHIIKLGVSKLIEYADNVHIAFLWPSGSKNWNKTASLFSNILYQEDKSLTFQGSFNLLYQCYKHMDWVGTKESGFVGLEKKRLECFPKVLNVRIVIFQENMGLGNVRKLKEKIRNINNIGYSSVHITDTKEEVMRLCQYVLNDNSWHFINYTKNNEILLYNSNLTKLKEKMNRYNIKPEDLIIDGSYVLEAYGIRKSYDLDVLISDLVPKDIMQNWETHDEELRHHGVRKDSLIYDPRMYFWFDGIKIISLSQIIQFKKHRSEIKDRVDISSANAFIKNKYFAKCISIIYQYIHYTKLRLKKVIYEKIKVTLKYIGIFNWMKACINHIYNR